MRKADKRRHSRGRRKPARPNATRPPEATVAVPAPATPADPAMVQTLTRAVQCHQAGDLRQAESLYRQVLAADPQQSVALHMLGVIAHQAGHHEAAADLIGRALALHPDYPDALVNLGNALQALGRYDEAVDSYRHALRLSPRSAETHYNLGNALGALGRLEQAVASYGEAIARKPDYAKAHCNLGNALQDLGKPQQAADSLRRALDIDPGYAEAHNNLGNVLQEIDEVKDAFDHFKKALALRPDYVQAHNNLGNLQLHLGQPEEAIASYRRALSYEPGYADAHNNLGNALKDQNKLTEAADSYRKAVALRPDYAEAHSNLGTALVELEQPDEALACYRKALEIRPDYAEAHYNIGNVLHPQGRLDEAVASYRRALEIKPDYPKAHSNLLLVEQYRPGHDAKSMLRLHQAWDRQHAAKFRTGWPRHGNDFDPQRRLRIGFVSPDLGRHPVGYFALPLFENLAREQVEVIVYSDRRADDLTARIREASDAWHEVRELTDPELAAKIKADAIDILIDLAGHSARNRLLVFARKPAPLQVSWAGYVATTGLAAMDYMISDRYSTLPQEEPHYSEKTIRMPDGWLCYAPPDYAPPVGPLPMLDNGYVTFASFSNPAKLNDQVLALWADILAAIDGSRLVLKYGGITSPQNTSRLSDHFEARGIARRRLVIEGKSPNAELLARYNDVDIALDPFPYSGGLTTYEALWMGVPVITLPGRTFASRHAQSHLSTLGLPELVARDREEYVKIAVDLAQDTDRLGNLRAGLRQQMASSPICDGKKFAEGFATLMRQIWCERCEAPAPGLR